MVMPISVASAYFEELLLYNQQHGRSKNQYKKKVFWNLAKYIPVCLSSPCVTGRIEKK